MLDRAEAIRPDGYALLLFDLRNHGASADAHTTLGVHERRDVCRAAAFARSRTEGPLVIWGVSMGAAAAMLGAGCAVADRVIAESAFDSLRNTVGQHLREGVGLPAFPAADLLVGVTGLRAGFAVREGDVRAAVAELGELPILFVAGGADWRMPPEISRGLLEASSSPRSRLYIVESAGHGRAWEVDPRGYLAAVRAFLADGTGPSPTDPAPTLY
jgi:pimeloyl-ACP methyl ester carboxylesterase